MSFSKKIKQEILQKPIHDKKCGLSFLYGLINANASFNIDSNDFDLSINSELSILGSFIQNILDVAFPKCEKLVLDTCEGINKVKYTIIKFPKSLAKQVLLESGVIKIKDNKIEKPCSYDQSLINDENSLKSFAQGVFVGCGTTNIKIDNNQRTTTGYHIEFASKNYNFLNDFANVLAQFDVFAKLIKRKNTFVLYVKDSNEVSDILAFLGAYNCVFDLQNELATREMRNKANRQTNCTSANIGKTIDASMKQMDAIQLIVETIGLENLPDDLQLVALLRLANTEESLDELIKLSKQPFTKSGLNYRFQKLIKIANKIKEK